MKKYIIIAMIVIMVLSVVSCGNNGQEYLDYLSGKQFKRTDGPVLTFYDDNTASYESYNMMGERFFYIYNVKAEKKNDEIVLTLEDLETKESEKAYLDTNNETVTYYGQIYYLVK